MEMRVDVAGIRRLDQEAEHVMAEGRLEHFGPGRLLSRHGAAPNWEEAVRRILGRCPPDIQHLPPLEREAELDQRVQRFLAGQAPVEKTGAQLEAELREEQARVLAEAARAQERLAQQRALMLEQSRIPAKHQVGLEQLDYRTHQDDAITAARDFAAAVAAGKCLWWLVLQGERTGANPGGNGIGKTKIALAAGTDVCRAQGSVRYWTEGALRREMFRRLSHHGDGGLAGLVEELCGVRLLILDNMGIDAGFSRRGGETESEFVRGQLLDILATREEQDLAVMITTNLCPDEFDARYGSDVWSRVFGMTQRRPSGGWIAFTGPDLREGWGPHA